MDLLLLGLRLLAAAILYAFLAALFVMLWRDLQGAADRREATHPSARLIVLETTERVLEAGTAFVVQRVTSVGRGPGNTISIPDSFVSGHHALLSWRGSQWWLEDQGSRNGTLLNGVPVGRPTVIAAGDIVGVGRTEFKLEMDDGSRASE